MGYHRFKVELERTDPQEIYFSCVNGVGLGTIFPGSGAAF